MKKTTLLIPEELKNKADRIAHRMGISFGRLAREAIAEFIEKPRGTKFDHDPFFDDNAFYECEVPKNGSVSYEDDLYGKRS